jgi:hypothetical protein
MKVRAVPLCLVLAVSAAYSQTAFLHVPEQGLPATEADRVAVLDSIAGVGRLYGLSEQSQSLFRQYASVARYNLSLIQQCAVFAAVFGSETAGYEALARAASAADGYDPSLDTALEVVMRFGATLGTVATIVDYADRRISQSTFEARLADYLAKPHFRTVAEGVSYRLLAAADYLRLTRMRQ